MSNMEKMVGAMALCVITGLASVVHAEQPRQYYSPYWVKRGGYYYRNYFFRPSPEEGYRQHYVIYYPSQPQYFYYFNPDTGKYWGRYDRLAKGYSQLPESEQNERLALIPDRAFPPPGDMPELKGSKDKLKMEPPPKGLPVDESDALSKEKMEQLAGVKDKPPPPQAYSDWCKQGGYYYVVYYYQPVPDGAYRSHRCIYYPVRPRYIYYYNPYTGTYWGRYDLEAKGYSKLPPQAKAGKLSAIAEAAFPKPGDMPSIPENKSGMKMAVPPTPPSD
jgi:hypothetical protein